MKLVFFILSCLFVFSGCVKDVKPWEKELFAKEEMKEGAGDNLNQKFTDHTYFSKEATKVGTGVGAGGCGCN